MKVMRQKETVEAFHYDLNQDPEAKTEIRVEINPLDMSQQEDFPSDESSVLGLRIVFKIVFEEFALTGAVSQLVTLPGRVVKTSQELTQSELDELMRPLFSIIERLAYDVTEIALDRPGVQLNFQQEE